MVQYIVVSSRPDRWAIIQTGMLRPCLKILGALGWASTWVSFIRIILDKLPHNRNLMKGNSGPIAQCPVCNRGKDSLEHLIRCEGNCLRTFREHFHMLLITDIWSYCERHGFADTTLKSSIEHAKGYNWRVAWYSNPPFSVFLSIGCCHFANGRKTTSTSSLSYYRREHKMATTSLEVTYGVMRHMLVLLKWTLSPLNPIPLRI